MEKQSFSYNYVRLFPKEQIGLHRQSSWELTFIVIGSGIKLIGDTTEPFQSGEVVIIPPDIPHCWYFNGNNTNTEGKIVNITLSFTNEFLDRCSLSFPELHRYIEDLKKNQEALKYNRSQSVTIASILKSMYKQNEVERLSSIIRLLAILPLADKTHIVGKYKERDRKQERLDMIRVFITCNAYRNISLDDVVRHVGMNKSAFCTFFKQSIGKTFITYLNEYRIERACQLLKQENISISEICYHVGFTDIPYFNRVFKKHKGCSPSQYRCEQ
ncbi:AraC family transcriptional regulator [uncultured Parabacteroides sp.]|uniref:AraC family transcriptional regulator n=1 Tax=uncultured Parabacteroides sp. TaxID=512312 RepID=UPI0025F91294|nr:AraC family transcriptional regulator [uncultured Parabacteroides sp.]